MTNLSDVIVMFLLPLVLLCRQTSGKHPATWLAWILAAGGLLTLTNLSEPVGTRQILHASDSWDSEYGSGQEAKLNDASTVRLREGTQIASTTGRFSRSGRRWIFEIEPAAQATGTTEAGVDNLPAKRELTPTRFRVLENLALQRVADAVAQDTNDVRWTVTAVVTEFDGENWLLLSTVFRASTTPATIEP